MIICNRCLIRNAKWPCEKCYKIFCEKCLTYNETDSIFKPSVYCGICYSKKKKTEDREKAARVIQKAWLSREWEII